MSMQRCAQLAVSGPFCSSPSCMVSLPVQCRPAGTGETPGDAAAYASGTFLRSSSSQTRALPSDGARQSPRGESEPPAATFGPFGMAERLNWLKPKKRLQEDLAASCRISARS